MRRWVLFLASILGMVLAPIAGHCQQAQKAVPRIAVPAMRLTPALRLTPAKRTGESLLRYVPDNVVIVGGIQPARMLSAAPLQNAVKGAKADDVFQEFMRLAVQQMGLEPSKILEAGFVLDQNVLLELAAWQKSSNERLLAKNNQKFIGLAMHNFYSSFQSFPDDDGIGKSKGNLSWRVHVLPFLDENELYNEFHLDEPWDSEHNKTLIGRMPDVFKVNGVDEAGKTTIHVLTGEGTPFGGNTPPTFQDITDGTSNTIMTVIGGLDTADTWTKPGGLRVDPEQPLKALGTLSGDILLGMMDGFVLSIEASVNPETFLKLARHQDAQIVELPSSGSDSQIPVPGLIVRYAEPFNKEILMPFILGQREGGAIEIEGYAATQIDAQTCVVFPDPQTMLISSESGLKAMLAERGESGALRQQFESLYPSNDVVVTGSFGAVSQSFGELLAENPFKQILLTITDTTLVLDATGDSKSLLDLRLTADSPTAAQQANGMISGFFQIMKAQMLNAMSQEGSGVPENVIGVLSDLLDSVEIKVSGQSVEMTMAKLEDPTKTFSDLKEEVTTLADSMRQLSAARQNTVKQSAIRQLGLAMHNYHDVWNCFPSWNSPNNDSENKGLSWRVYLLPYLDQSALYQQFHLDEAWDSEHNKTLIQKMPDVFKTEGVEEAGKTSFHVFLGEKTPLGSKENRSIREVTDGTSNTLMIVQAGPDKAEIWTKPTGLEYDPEDPLKCLGNVGEQFLVLLCDGSSRFLDSTIDKATFRRLIEHSDDEVVGDF